METRTNVSYKPYGNVHDAVNLLNNMLKALHTYILSNKKMIKDNEACREDLYQIVRKIYTCFNIPEIDTSSISFEIDWYLSEMNFYNNNLKPFQIMKTDPIGFNSEKFNSVINEIKNILANTKSVSIQTILNPYLQHAKFLQQAMPFVNLPIDMLTAIFLFLDVKSLHKIGQTCKRFNEVAAMDQLWKQKTINKYELDDGNRISDLLTKYGSYKKIYISKPFSSLFILCVYDFTTLGLCQDIFSKGKLSVENLIKILEVGDLTHINSMKDVEDSLMEVNIPGYTMRRYVFQITLPVDKAIKKLSTPEGRSSLIEFITQVSCVSHGSTETVNLKMEEKNIIFSKQFEPIVHRP